MNLEGLEIIAVMVVLVLFVKVLEQFGLFEPVAVEGKLSPGKQAQLRNFLSKRKMPPVRSTAPANLSRSAFLSPRFYDDFDEVSSTSSISQAPDPEEIQEEEEEKEDVLPVRIPRHAPVVRTTSIVPGLLSQSPVFGKPQLSLGPAMQQSPGSSRTIPLGADSTKLATRTVKHGAPPSTTIPAQQAAAAAALRRQMGSQVQAVSPSLTESTLKAVPQVVNVLELRSSGPIPTSPAVIGSNVPHSAAQAIQQVLASVATSQTKQGATVSAIKGNQAPVPVAPPSVSTAQLSPNNNNKVSGPVISKSEVAMSSSVSTSSQPGKNFSFSSAGTGFSFGASASTTTPNSIATSEQAAVSTLGKASSLPGAFSNISNVPKPVFSTTSEAPFSFSSMKLPLSSSATIPSNPSTGAAGIPLSSSATIPSNPSTGAAGIPLSSSATIPSNPSTGAAGIPLSSSATIPSNSSTGISTKPVATSAANSKLSKPEPQAAKPGESVFQNSSAGETLGSFSGLRVGQTDENAQGESPDVQPADIIAEQPVQTAALTSGFTFGGIQQVGKPVESFSISVPPSTAPTSSVKVVSTTSSSLFGNLQLTSGSSSTLFSYAGAGSGGKPSFAFGTSQLSGNTVTSSTGESLTSATSSAPLSFSSLLTSAPVALAAPSTGNMKAAMPSEPPSKAEATVSSSTTLQLTPQQASQTADPAVNVGPPTCLDTALATTTTVSSTSLLPLTGDSSSMGAPVTDSNLAPTPPTPTSDQSTLSQNTVSSVVTALHTTTVSAITAPSSTSTSTQSPVLATSEAPPATSAPTELAHSSDPNTLAIVSTSAPSATTLVFGQVAATTASSLFGQLSGITVTTSATATTVSAFGLPPFGTGVTTGFSQPAFGQTPAFGQPSSSTAASFSFGQSAFGAVPAFGQATSTAVSGTGSLFGASPSTSSASSFSFGQPSTGSSGGGSLFGQSGTPAFGQTATFGQSGSLFGNVSSATTTTCSSGFSFVQSTGFGSSSIGSVFGQAPGTGASIFGQQPSSPGGGMFGSSSRSGGFFSGLGGKPSQEAANKNPFGTSGTAFGSPAGTNASSLFGNSGAKAFGFGNTSFGDQKPSGTFSAGEGSVASQGFGFSSPSKTGGFGAAPVFGSPPTFGGSPGFGGVPAFGSAPAFASPLGSTGGKVFGEGTAAASTGGFGFGTTNNTTTFGSIASQSTPTFGSLTQPTSGFGAPSSGFPGFGSGAGAPSGPAGTAGGFGFGTPNQSASGFSGWRS